jgi:outer membrane protein OmpA-like peptidoglycan-associated protein
MNAARRAPLGLAVASLLFFPLSLSAQTLSADVAGTSMTPSPYTGALAPDFGGEIGLFTVPTGDTLPAGAFSLGLYFQNTKLLAGENPNFPTEGRNRMYEQSSFQGSIGFGITNHFQLFAAAGEDRFESRGGWVDGFVNDLEFSGPFKQTEPRKIRIGGKVSLWSALSSFRFAIYGAAHLPLANDQDHVNTRRTDWEIGASGSYGILTGNVSYTISGRRSTEPDVRVSNRLRLAAGTDVPFGPFLHWISEIDRNVFDHPTVPEGSPDIKENDYTNFLTGVRFFIGHTGWAVSAAAGVNVDMLARTKFSPTPLGGLVGITYAPFPAPPPAPKPLPPVETKAEETAATTTTTEAPAPPPPAAPPAPQSKQTTDVIQFDRGARLTNIAKAILDGVALRMKNDLNSTAVITGYSDNSGSDEANMKVSQQRADAAKNYLVERHGIDAGRIKTEARGSAEPAADNATPEGRAKNRRAVIVVTFVSGS